MQDVNKAAQHFPSLIKLKWLPFCIWLMGEKCIRPWKVLSNRNGVSFFSLDHMTHLANWSSPKQCWAAHSGFVSTFLGKSQVSMMQPWCSPNYCLSRPGQVRVGTALTSSPPFPKTEHSSSPSEPGLGLPRTCQELKVVFFLPQEVIFLGTAALGCQSLGFTKAHVCVTVALLLGMLEFPFQILCLSAAGIFLWEA